MGKEIVDPQTQLLLSRMESPCCDVVIEKVAATRSYGHLKNTRMQLDSALPDALQIREELRFRSFRRYLKQHQRSTPLEKFATDGAPRGRSRCCWYVSRRRESPAMYSLTEFTFACEIPAINLTHARRRDSVG
jgi:hypothetical protein